MAFTALLRPIDVFSTRVCSVCGGVFDSEQRVCPADGAPLELRTPADPLIGRTIADRYLIQELLGVGGMGRVYVAEHVALGRKSAVKVISPEHANSADAISRFNREAANASRINHPNIAQIYDFGESDGTLYLAMEFIEGEVLSTVLERLGPLPLGRAASITMQIADALAAAHQLGIVHRDLKPENIMIGRRHDGADWVKVVDFGIAKTVESERSQTVTMTGVALGTPEYMSPEQFAGEKLDHRTDIYSLGLVTFNMLTGKLPHPIVTSKESLVKRLTTAPRPLSEVMPDVAWPAGLQTALDRALAPDAADRYHRATDFGTDVSRAADRAEGARRGTVPGAPGAEPPTAPRLPSVPRPQSAPRRAQNPPVPTPRRRVWPWVALLLLGAAGWGSYTYAHEIELRLGLVTPSMLRSTPIVAAPDSSAALPDVAVTPPSDTLDGGADSITAPAPAALPPRPVKHPASDSAATSVATTGAAPPPNGSGVAQQGSQAMPHLAGQLRHPWLRINGDSGAMRVLDDGIGPDEVEHAQLEELQGHIARGMRFASRADVPRARIEFREASEEGRGLQLADRDLTARVDFLLRNAMRDSWQVCQRARGDSTNASAQRTDCGTLFAW